jgi:hypothetical protein
MLKIYIATTYWNYMYELVTLKFVFLIVTFFILMICMFNYVCVCYYSTLHSCTTTIHRSFTFDGDMSCFSLWDWQRWVVYCGYTWCLLF